MAAKQLTTRIVFNGIDRVSKVLGNIQRKVDGASKQMQRASRGIRQSGSASAMMITAPLTMVGRSISDTYAEFESASTKVEAITESTAEQMRKLEKTALKLAETNPFKPTEMMAANQQLAEMGQTFEQMMASLPEVVKFSIIGDVELPDAADRLTNIMTSFHGDMASSKLASELKILNDQLSILKNNVNLNADQATQGLERLAPTASALGIDQSESLAMMGAIAKAGFKGVQAANALRTIMLRINAPTKAALQAFEKIGINLDKFREYAPTAIKNKDVTTALAAGGVTGGEAIAPELNAVLSDKTLSVFERVDKSMGIIQDKLGEFDAAAGEAIADALMGTIQRAAGGINEMAVFKELHDKTGGRMDGEIGNAIFGKQRFAQGAALVKNIEAYEALLDKVMNKSTGYADRIVKKYAERYAQVVDTMESRLEGMKIKLGKVFIEDAIKAIEAVGQAFVKIGDWAEANPALARLAARIAAITAVAAPALIYIGFVGQGIAALGRLAGAALLPFTKLASTITGLAYSSTLKGKGIMTLVGGLARLTVVGAAVSGVLYTMYKGFQRVSDLVGARMSVAFESAKMAYEDWAAGDKAAAAKHMAVAFDQVTKSVQDVGRAMADVAKDGWQLVRDNFSVIDEFSKMIDVEGIKAKFGDLTASFKPLSEAFGKLTQGFKDLFNINAGGDSTLSDRFGQAFGWVTDVAIKTGVDGVTAVVNALSKAMGTLGETFTKASQGDWVGVFKTLADGINAQLANAWKFIQKFVENVSGDVLPEWNVGGWLDSLLNKFESLSNAIDNIKSAYEKLTSFISDRKLPDLTPDEIKKLSIPQYDYSNVPENIIGDTSKIKNGNIQETVTTGEKIGAFFSDVWSFVKREDAKGQQEGNLSGGIAGYGNDNAPSANQETIGEIRRQTAAAERVKEAADKSANENAQTASNTAAISGKMDTLINTMSGFSALAASGGRPSAGPAQAPVPVSGNGLMIK